MARSAFSKVMWVGRATVFMVGLAVILALLFGVATTALGATGGNFILGQANVASAVSKLAGNVPGGAVLQVSNPSAQAGSKALQLGVSEGKAPLAVDAAAGTATNLSADELDGKDSADYQPRVKWARLLVSGGVPQVAGSQRAWTGPTLASTRSSSTRTSPTAAPS